jgi:predicted ABC-type ATPase
MNLKPVLLVIAGPNGSGKTTVTVKLRRDQWSEGVEYINPDDIAQEKFGGWNSAAATLQAAQYAENKRLELLEAGVGIAFETVFSAPDKVKFLEKAKTAGYFVRVFFVGTADPKINAARIVKRVLEGGHTVPLEKIISRYEKSMVNLAAAIAIADRVYIYDNSLENTEAALCVRVVDGKIRKVYQNLPLWVEDAIEGVEKHPDFELEPASNMDA